MTRLCAVDLDAMFWGTQAIEAARRLFQSYPNADSDGLMEFRVALRAYDEARGVAQPDLRALLDEAERRFWKDEREWTKAGSGQTREQQTGAHMVWSWIKGGGIPFAAIVAAEKMQEELGG